MCAFSKQVGESQAQPKLQRVVATLRKRQQEKVEARAQTEGAVWQEEVAWAKMRVQGARRAVENEHESVYQKVVAEHEWCLERAVPYKTLRYIQELAEAGRPQEIRAVRLRDGRAPGNRQEVLEEEAKSFWEQHSQGQQGLSETTRRMFRALLRVFTEQQSEAIHRSRVTLGEITGVVRAVKRKKSPEVEELVAEAYQKLDAPELDGLTGRITEVLGIGRPPVE